MTRFLLLPLLAAVAVSGCDSTNDDPMMFTVTIENVSTPGTVAGDRAQGAVPLSPPAWAVFTGADPMFTVGQLASEGTARIGEDGFPEAMAAQLMTASNVKTSGVATSPGGADMGPAVFPALGGAAAESVTFSFMASPGDKLQFETMFVQSNDWFYAFSGGGLDLFDGDNAVRGDVTSRLRVYDAGSEEDTAPGTGPTALPGPIQKPVQPPTASNLGTDESVVVALASERHSFAIPANDRVIRVTVTPSN